MGGRGEGAFSLADIAGALMWLCHALAYFAPSPEITRLLL